jgi:hypothetical protein
LVFEKEAATLGKKQSKFGELLLHLDCISFDLEETVFYQEIIEGLFRENIRYLIVGGLAVNLHGVPRTTLDLDLILATDADNIQKFCILLQSLGYVTRLPLDPRKLADENTVKEWIDTKHMKAFSFYHGTENRKVIDIVLGHPFDFTEAFERKTVLHIGETELYVLSLEDLMAMKQNTGRPKDTSDAELLSQVKQIREEGYMYGV